jgi:hypothetical protein
MGSSSTLLLGAPFILRPYVQIAVDSRFLLPSPPPDFVPAFEHRPLRLSVTWPSPGHMALTLVCHPSPSLHIVVALNPWLPLCPPHLLAAPLVAVPVLLFRTLHIHLGTRGRSGRFTRHRGRRIPFAPVAYFPAAGRR